MRTTFKSSRAVCSLSLGALLSVALPCAAQSNPQALSLLEEGKKLLNDGRFAESCETLRRSIDVEEAINTYYQLGRCNAELSRFASARQAFLKAAQMSADAKDGKREQAARARADELLSRIPKVKITAEAQANLAIELNGIAVSEADWGKEQEVDPGSYTVSATAPGMQKWTQNVEASATGGVVEVAVPRLQPEGSGGDGAAKDEDATEGDAGPTQRRNPAGFKAGMGLTIGGGALLLIGVAVAATANNWCTSGCPTGNVVGGGVAVGVLGLAALGTGIPLMIVFGRKVPVEPGASSDENKPEENKPEENKPEEKQETLLTLEPILSPTWMGLRLQF